LLLQINQRRCEIHPASYVPLIYDNDNDNRFICTERPPAQNTNIHAVIISSDMVCNINNNNGKTC